MHTSRFVQLLKVCQKEEIKTFKKFMRSPYFNTNANLVKLCDNILKHGPDYTSKKLERERLFKAVFPNDVYKESRIQRMMMELTNLLELFWVNEEMKANQVGQNLLTAEVYLRKGKRHYWEMKLNHNNKLLAKDSAIDIKHYFNALQNNIAFYRGIEEEGIRDREPNLQMLLDNLDTFTFVNKLKYYYKAINFQRFKKQDYELRLQDEILSFLEEQTFEVPIVQIYYYGLRAALSPDERKYFDELKSLLFNHYHLFAKKELVEMFSMAHNYCIRHINQGKAEFVRELFDLYRLEVEEKIIVGDRKAPSSTYRNITTIALLAKERVWLESFLNDYKEAVSEEDYALNISQLYFVQARYQDIIQLFRARDYEDNLFRLYAYSTLIRTYYELRNQNPYEYDYEEELENRITNFSAFLNRNKKALPKHAIFYANFNRSVKALLRLIQEPKLNKKHLAELETKIRDEKQITEKRWLLQKVKELK